MREPYRSKIVRSLKVRADACIEDRLLTKSRCAPRLEYSSSRDETPWRILMKCDLCYSVRSTLVQRRQDVGALFPSLLPFTLLAALSITVQ